jgi:hypothetical protein
MKQNVKVTAWQLTQRKKVFFKPTLATLTTLNRVDSVVDVARKTKINRSEINHSFPKN